MGNSESVDRFSDADSYEHGIIDSYAINDVIRNHMKILSSNDHDLLIRAQEEASCQLRRTMKNCKLYIELDNINVVLKSGDCSNKILIKRDGRGNIVWQYLERSATQILYDIGGGIMSFVKAAGGAIASVAGHLAIEWIKKH